LSFGKRAFAISIANSLFPDAVGPTIDMGLLGKAVTLPLRFFLLKNSWETLEKLYEFLYKSLLHCISHRYFICLQKFT
ncbi:MAG: hypothetical protein J6O91_00730, partial [Aeriscardovia sp.]|nr:hypothetical protein [Aeriscardovia sp.]